MIVYDGFVIIGLYFTAGFIVLMGLAYCWAVCYEKYDDWKKKR